MMDPSARISDCCLVKISMKGRPSFLRSDVIWKYALPLEVATPTSGPESKISPIRPTQIRDNSYYDFKLLRVNLFSRSVFRYCLDSMDRLRDYTVIYR